jgi:hypothetical protein
MTHLKTYPQFKMDPSDFSIQQKAEKKFGTFPYELSPTKDYLFSLYQFYLEEEENTQSFSKLQVPDIKNLGDMIGFQNYHTSIQSKKFIKDWVKKTFDWSDQTFDQEWNKWQMSPPADVVKAEHEIEKIYEESYQPLSSLYTREQVEERIKNIFDLYDELRKVPEECIEEPPHPVRFLQHRVECQVQLKKLRKSLKKTNHPLASIFHESLYGKYLFMLEDTFPIEYKMNYLNLCIIYAFRKTKNHPQ